MNYPKKKKNITKIILKKRIVIEHTICKIEKVQDTCNDVFRNKLRKYNKVSDIVSGLINYRIMNHY